MTESFVLDVDGCILDTNGYGSYRQYKSLGQISDFVKLGNLGLHPKIRLCSGRDGGYIESTSMFIGLPDSFSVIESGLAIFNPTTKERIYNPVFTPELKATFEQISQDILPLIMKKCPGLSLYQWNDVNIALDWFPSIPFSVEDCYQITRDALGDLVGNGVVLHHSSIAIDISPQGIDKGSGLKFLVERENLDLSGMVGVGDSNGDRPMMELVGQVGCPSNASEECKKFVKEKNGYISPYAFARGVLNVMNNFM